MKKKPKKKPKPHQSAMLREYYPLVMPKEKPTGSAMLRQYVYCPSDEYFWGLIEAVDRTVRRGLRIPKRRKK